MASVAERLNRAFDLLPRDTVRLGPREVPVFRSIGIVGFHLAVLTAVLAGIRAGVPVLDVIGLSAIAGASFFALAVVRRSLAGRESLVLLEHVWVAAGAVALYFLAAGGPVLPGLDVFATGVCVFLAAGRLGCLTAGCCHGHPAGLGIVYRASTAVPERLRGVRLFPVPLVEAVALLAIGVVGYLLCGGTPGTATVWMLLAYAVVRFGTEALRGDPRPSAGGVTLARAMAVVQLLAALLAAELWLVPGGFGRRDVVAAVVLGTVLLAGCVLARRRRDPLATPAHLDELWSAVRTLARSAPAGGAPPAVAGTSQGVQVAASWEEVGLHVSLSHPSRPVDGLPFALGHEPFARTATATHLVVPDQRAGPRPGASPSGSPTAPGATPIDRTGSDYFGTRDGLARPADAGGHHPAGTGV